jgi:hypothetical protein
MTSGHYFGHADAIDIAAIIGIRLMIRQVALIERLADALYGFAMQVLPTSRL